MIRNREVNFDPNEIHETLLTMSEQLGKLSVELTLQANRLAALERYLPALETAHAGTVAPLSDMSGQKLVPFNGDVV